MDLGLGAIDLKQLEEMDPNALEKTEGSSINFSEKVVLVENTLASTPRKTSQFSETMADSHQRSLRCSLKRDNSFDKLAKTFGFGHFINTCFMSESECVSDIEEENKEEMFMGHKMKTLHIIEDDISDLEGSIDQAAYGGNINRLLDRSGEIKYDSI